MNPIKIEARPVAEITENLKNGFVMNDLSWAWNSSVACFPATQQEYYTGKHILFEVILPPKSEMKITLIPANPNTEMSLYGYQIGANSNAIVPDLSSCVTCNADNNQTGRATNNHRGISFMAIRRPYKIIIGVAGAKGLSEGEFSLKVEINNR